LNLGLLTTFKKPDAFFQNQKLLLTIKNKIMKLKKSVLLLGTALVTTSAIFFACQKEVKPGSASSSTTSDAKGGGTAGAYDTLTLACAGSNTQHSISLIVTAGTSGAPAGFSIQWATDAQLAAYTGPVDKTGWPIDTNAFCKASFSGVPYGSKNTVQAGSNAYNLGSGASVTVVIGSLLDDELNQQLGYSTTCHTVEGLDCGTHYVFRAFAHGDSKKGRSAFTIFNNPCATTSDCGTCNRFGYGHWRNSPDDVAALITANGGTLSLGDHAYTASEIMSILLATPNGNGYIILAHQLISADLNNLNNPGGCLIDVSTADAEFVGVVVPPVGSSFISNSKLAGDIATLHGKNNSCDDCTTPQ
jgi:hypothetical protein